MALLPQQIKHLISQPKSILYPLPQAKVATNSNNLEIRCDVQDRSGVTIAGMQVVLVQKMNSVFCNEKYTLFYSIQGQWERIFQIEVYDKRKMSHRDGQLEWYGPHLHYNGVARICAAKFACGDEHRERWFYRFCRHTNMTVQSRTPPYQLGLEKWH